MSQCTYDVLHCQLISRDEAGWSTDRRMFSSILKQEKALEKKESISKAISVEIKLSRERARRFSSDNPRIIDKREKKKSFYASFLMIC